MDQHEVQALISIWPEDEVQRESESVSCKEKVYQNIYMHLAELGITSLLNSAGKHILKN